MINRLQEKQEKRVLTMKTDLQNEIKRGITAYKVNKYVYINKYLIGIKEKLYL